MPTPPIRRRYTILIISLVLGGCSAVWQGNDGDITIPIKTLGRPAC